MKSVYTGGEKVAEFESYDELRVGDGKPAFIYEGNELVYPSPVKDGLVLWYDFSGRTNTDGQRGIAEDLSGNGNHGTLQNFNYTPESGYDKNKLLFDGVDDHIEIPLHESQAITGGITIEQTVLKLDDYNIEDGFGWDWLLTNGSNAASQRGYSLFLSAQGELSFAYGAYVRGTGYFPKKGDLFNISVSWNEDKILIIYLNGKLIYNSLQTAIVPDVSPYSLRIGKARYYSSSPHLTGAILSTKIYNRGLSPEEIAHNYAIEKERFGIE